MPILYEMSKEVWKAKEVKEAIVSQDEAPQRLTGRKRLSLGGKSISLKHLRTKSLREN